MSMTLVIGSRKQAWRGATVFAVTASSRARARRAVAHGCGSRFAKSGANPTLPNTAGSPTVCGLHPTGLTVALDGEVLAVGPGAIVCAAARKLIAQGHHPAERLEAWRSDRLCLAGLLGVFAKLIVRDNRHGRPIFCRYRTPALGARQAPPIAQMRRLDG